VERSQTYCTNCGAGIGESDKFCPKCGNSVTGIADREVEEKEVYSFGPMGVRICFSRPSMFARTIKNMTKIALTNRRIYGSPKGSLIPMKLLPFKGSAQFQVSYDSILAIEQVSLGLWKGFWIQYRDENKSKEVSILCDPINYHHISKAYDLLQAAKASIR